VVTDGEGSGGGGVVEEKMSVMQSPSGERERRGKLDLRKLTAR
jgi:hypothetical protein